MVVMRSVASSSFEIMAIWLFLRHIWARLVLSEATVPVLRFSQNLFIYAVGRGVVMGGMRSLMDSYNVIGCVIVR